VRVEIELCVVNWVRPYLSPVFFVLGLTVRVEIELCFVSWVGSYLSPVFLRYEDFCAGFYGAGSLWLRTAVFVVGFFLRTKISLTDDPVF
jgi:hypothetical protein